MEKTIQVGDFEAAFTTEVKSQGRISGLTKYIGRKCIIIIEKEEKKE
ncbi:MAG: hypothetical protein J7J93_00950 [Candidatus Aenigmarchaeota archaeon]|nr:hypothetical protein [Candidatus Aenigmarchaeota archaeon]